MTDNQITYRITSTRRHVERLDDETLVYDLDSDTVHQLTPSATAVWDACGTGAAPAALTAATGSDPELVARALVDLTAAGLIEQADPDGISRRQFGARVAAGAVVVASYGLVSSLAAPSPAAASSEDDGGGSGGNN